MLLLRLLLILSALAIVLSGVFYIFTRDARYLNFAWKIVRFSVVAACAIFTRTLCADRLARAVVGRLSS